MDDLDNQTEEVFQGGTTDQWRDYADSLQVSTPEISLKDATTFVASMTPVIGDAMAAKEVYDELKKVNPNYYLAGALGGATIVGLIPGIGDAAAKAIMNGAREVFDVAKRVKPKPIYSELSDRVKNKDFKVVPSETKKVSSTELPPAENSARTQIAGTLPTYKKADNLLTELAGDGKTLDFGAGLGLSKKELDFDTYEPFPKKDFNPDFTDPSDIPSESYKKVTNLNVLNVVPKDVRDTIVKDIGRILEPDGRAVITTRGRDVMSAKGKPGPEEMSIITTKDTYQKGFTQPELKLYIQETLGEGFDITNNKLGAAGVTVHKLPNKGYAEGGTIMDEQMRKAFALGGSVDLDTVPDNTQGIDPVSGNEVPMGSTPKEVRDDIPAQLSEGEYVVPSDVVRFYGVRFFENLRAKAKFGYQDMAENGRIGGEPVDELDGMMFDVSELEVEDDGEPMAMNEGGYALSPGDEGYETMGALGLGSEGISAGYESTGAAPTIEVRTYVSESGHTIYITFINGKPQTSIPPGYTLQEETTAETTTTAETVAQPVAQVVTPSGRDRSSQPMPAPKAINYKTLTTEEIAKMLEDQTSAKSTAIAFGAGAINPVLGLFVKGAMMDSARRLENEIERRIASEEYVGDRGVLEDMLKASKEGKPGLIQKIFGAVKNAFVPETQEEAEALEIAMQMDTGDVSQFEGDINLDVDPIVKTDPKLPTEEEVLAPTTGKVSTYVDPVTREETKFESYGQVTRNGVYAGDGFEWYETDVKSSDGTPVLGRRYTGEGEDNNLGRDTIIATELGYGDPEDREVFVKIADISLEEGSEFAAKPGSANDGDFLEFLRTGSFGASDSFADQEGKDFTPTLTYGDALEQVKKPDDAKPYVPETVSTKVEPPSVSTPIVDETDPNAITTSLLYDNPYGDPISYGESKALRDRREAEEAAKAAKAAEAASLAEAKRRQDEEAAANAARISRGDNRDTTWSGGRVVANQTAPSRKRSRNQVKAAATRALKPGQKLATGGRATGGLVKKPKKK